MGAMTSKRFFQILCLFLPLFLLSCASIKRAAIKSITGTPGKGEGNAFTRDDDPELVGAAIPSMIKLLESVLDADPGNPELHFTIGQTTVIYANLFVQEKADRLSDEYYEEKEKLYDRAKKFYLRGADFIYKGLLLKNRKLARKIEDEDFEAALAAARKKDVPYLTWYSMGILAALSIDPLNLDLLSESYQPTTFLYRSLEIDETFENGNIHGILISLSGSLPEGIIYQAFEKSPETFKTFYENYYGDQIGEGHSVMDRATHHFERAIALSEGKNPSPYIAMATTLAGKGIEYEKFQSLLEEALTIDPNDDPENRLATTVFQEKAQWLLDNAGDYYLLDDDWE